MNQNLKYSVRYRDYNSDWWVHHSEHDSIRDARWIKKAVVTDERKRGLNTVWQIVRWNGKAVR